eukprot:gnl/Hemi2/12340_TR4224_c0_g1_i1.p1 gnl/Hemi2/12340_TR4224_c0_g1~~gnl/Hemi2/12340_TR4224_c0_g1_i1.p1  ORF type:complete len:447 (-),score=89.96 gnl/Hemi2/12340_TR4224_c0_g1_i1:1237-2577(-)
MIYLYCRKSSEGQDAQSLEQQRVEMLQYIESQEALGQMPRKVLEEVKSARQGSYRPVFMSLQEKVSRGDVVMVATTCRLTRASGDIYFLDGIFSKGADILVARGGLHWSEDLQQRAIKHGIFTAENWLLDKIQDANRSVAFRRQRGDDMGPVPFGFVRKTCVDGAKRFFADDKEQSTISAVGESEEDDPRKILELLIETGQVTPGRLSGREVERLLEQGNYKRPCDACNGFAPQVECGSCGLLSHWTRSSSCAGIVNCPDTELPVGTWYCPACRLTCSDDVVCQVCRLGEDEAQLLLCDNCNRGFHTGCLGLEDVPEGDWLCLDCDETDLFVPNEFYPIGTRVYVVNPDVRGYRWLLPATVGFPLDITDTKVSLPFVLHDSPITAALRDIRRLCFVQTAQEPSPYFCDRYPQWRDVGYTNLAELGPDDKPARFVYPEDWIVVPSKQ